MQSGPRYMPAEINVASLWLIYTSYNKVFTRYCAEQVKSLNMIQVDSLPVCITGARAQHS